MEFLLPQSASPAPRPSPFRSPHPPPRPRGRGCRWRAWPRVPRRRPTPESMSPAAPSRCPYGPHPRPCLRRRPRPDAPDGADLLPSSASSGRTPPPACTAACRSAPVRLTRGVVRLAGRRDPLHRARRGPGVPGGRLRAGTGRHRSAVGGESDGVEVRVLPETGAGGAAERGAPEPQGDVDPVDVASGEASALPAGLRLDLVDPGRRRVRRLRRVPGPRGRGSRTGVMTAAAKAASAANSALVPLGAVEIPPSPPRRPGRSSPPCAAPT